MLFRLLGPKGLRCGEVARIWGTWGFGAYGLGRGLCVKGLWLGGLEGVVCRVSRAGCRAAWLQGLSRAGGAQEGCTPRHEESTAIIC